MLLKDSKKAQELDRLDTQKWAAHLQKVFDKIEDERRKRRDSLARLQKKPTSRLSQA